MYFKKDVEVAGNPQNLEITGIENWASDVKVKDVVVLYFEKKSWSNVVALTTYPSVLKPILNFVFISSKVNNRHKVPMPMEVFHR